MTPLERYIKFNIWRDQRRKRKEFMSNRGEDWKNKIFKENKRLEKDQ